MSEYRRGFKPQAEQLSEGARAELGVENIDALDPLRLARSLAIPVLALRDLPGLVRDVPGLDDAVGFLLAEEQATLSAVTVFCGTERVVVYNDSHDEGRQASDLMHELAHGLLLHSPSPAFDDGGCRAWDNEIELEANYLGGALLIPGKGARYLAKAGYSIEAGAHRFRCSTQMVNWRLNESGARRLMKQ